MLSEADWTGGAAAAAAGGRAATRAGCVDCKKPELP